MTRHVNLATLGGIAMAVLGGLSVKPAQCETDQHTIQGTWEVVSLHRDGKKYEHLHGAIYVISKGEIRVVRDEEEVKDSDSNLKTTSSVYSLNPDARPKQIDWTTTQQFKTWRPSHPDGSGVLDPFIGSFTSRRKGVYAFEGNRLKLCFRDTVLGQADAVRATDFSTKPGDRRTLIVLRRTEPDEPAGVDDREIRLWNDLLSGFKRQEQSCGCGCLG